MISLTFLPYSLQSRTNLRRVSRSEGIDGVAALAKAMMIRPPKSMESSFCHFRVLNKELLKTRSFKLDVESLISQP
jgi:hypothetical protein